MNKNINLNLYKSYYYVAKYRSYTKAANELYLAQPNLSKNIKKLEDELQLKLIDRKNKKIFLTEDGIILYDSLSSMSEEFTNIEKKFMESNNLQKGKINIGVRSHIAQFFLLDYIKRFKELYPGIQINILSKSTAIMLEKLQSREVDFIIDVSPIECKNHNIVCKEIIKLTSCFISSVEIKQKLSINDVCKLNLITPPLNSSIMKDLIIKFDQPDFILNPYLTCETSELIIKCVKRNMGIGYTFKEFVKRYLDTSQMYEIEIEEKLPVLKLNLLYINKSLSKASTKLIDMLFEEME